jgi:hypothetical protein
MAKAFNKVTSGINPLGLKDRLTFGKYKNMQVLDILETDLEYLRYLVVSKIIKLNIEAQNKLLITYSNRSVNFKVKHTSFEDIPF